MNRSEVYSLHEEKDKANMDLKLMEETTLEQKEKLFIF